MLMMMIMQMMKMENEDGDDDDNEDDDEDDDDDATFAILCYSDRARLVARHNVGCPRAPGYNCPNSAMRCWQCETCLLPPLLFPNRHRRCDGSLHNSLPTHSLLCLSCRRHISAFISFLISSCLSARSLVSLMRIRSFNLELELPGICACTWLHCACERKETSFLESSCCRCCTNQIQNAIIVVITPDGLEEFPHFPD